MPALVDQIRDQTRRSLWSLRNVIDCVPDAYWERPYCGAPVWKHVYHTLHSLDRWYINPFVYDEPPFHTPGLNDLDAETGGFLSREQMEAYFARVEAKIFAYWDNLDDEQLAQTPEHCLHTRFTLILAQHRHLDMHIGMLMGFIIAGEDRWPRVLGLETDFPSGEYDRYF